MGTGGIDSGSPFSYPAAANLVLFTFINTLALSGVIDIVVELTVLAAFGVMLTALAAVVLRRAVVRP